MIRYTSVLAVATTAAVICVATAAMQRGETITPEVPVCATEAPSMTEMLTIEHADRGVVLTDQVTIPIVFQVIDDGAGNGNVPDAWLINQVSVLNSAFSGTAGGAATPFRFELQAIVRTTNAAWYTAGYRSPEEYAMKEALRQGGASTLNIYVLLSPWNWGSFPWLYSGAPLHDGVVLRNTGLPGAGDPWFGTGDICVHEVGHWLGLYHTYQGECSDPNDFVVDTPAMKATGVQSDCSSRDSCKGKRFAGNDPLNNYMTGRVDSCMNQFTSGQSQRMESMFASYRQ
jgi:hypothetical protein